MSRLQQVREGVLNHPLHRACDLELVHSADGRAEVRFAVNDFSANPQGALHGGILYAMMDVACFFAVVPQLNNDQHPVSVEVHTSVLRAALHGETVVIRSWVDRLGRTLAAMRCDALVINEDGSERLIGTGNVTKSILTGRGR
ncbi:MAG: PaaI family thioesterase [Alcanivoracaceae bacterium]|nr:PaaI family thioesterase [Alcanivoracaceae bacterium]